MDEQVIAGTLRNLVEKAYGYVDDADAKVGTVFANTGLVLGGVLETAKQILVEADKALAEYDKTEEVKLGADLDADLVNDKHDYEDESEPSIENKLDAINKAADEHFGQDGHVWWLVEINDFNRAAIATAYDKLVAGTLFDVERD